MNQERDKQGVVIEMTPEPETPPAPTKGRKLPVILLLLFILLIGAAGLLIYPYWQKIEQDLNLLQQRIADATQVQDQMQSELATAIDLTRRHQAIMEKQAAATEQQLEFIAQQKDAFSQQDRRIASAEHGMVQREQELGAAIDQVRKLAGKPDTRWMVAEAQYLLQLANQRLYLAHDPSTARLALQRADQRLAATGEAYWNDVRSQVEREIENLAHLTIPEIEPVSRELDRLIQQVPQLKLANRPLGTTGDQGAAVVDQKAEAGWQDLLGNIWEGTKEAIRIHRSDRPVAPLIAPQQTLLIYQNLRLMLESTRLALLQRDDQLFREGLARAGQWLETHFDGHNLVTQSMGNSLQQLAALELLPELPDIGLSLKYLQTAAARKGLPTPPKGLEAAQ